MAGLSTVNCPEFDAAVSVHRDCTATYTTTQADVDRGSITNTGTAHGTPPTGPEVTNDSTATVPATVSPAVTIRQVGDPAHLLGHRHADRLPLRGHEHRQRDVEPRDGHRPASWPVRGFLPRHVARSRGGRDVHRDLHDHPGRPRRRKDRQHRNGHRDRAQRPRPDASVVRNRFGHPSCRASDSCKTASIGIFSAAGTPITYSVRGHQQRQRDTDCCQRH